MTQSLRRHLTVRETEVLELLALGLSNAEIGSNLGLTVHAVKFHLASLYRKLEVANRTQAAAAFLRAAQPLEAASSEQT